MTTIDAEALPPTHTRPVRPSPYAWLRRDRVVGWLLLAAWIVLAASTVALGTRDSTYATLEAGVAAGDVGHVEVAGEPLDAGFTGYHGVQLTWRQDGIRRTAWVTEASNDRQGRVARHADETAVVVGRVEDRLSALDPDLRFSPTDHRSFTFVVAGTAVPGWVALGWLAVVVTCLFLNGAARPWRATSWAWTWLILFLAPYGTLAFLVLGGPLGILAPRDPRRVALTGGWAFLLAIVVGGAANGA